MTVRRLLPLLVLLFSLPLVQAAVASHTAPPSAVGVPGSYQSEAGCPGDWQPDCAATKLTYDAGDDVWQGTFSFADGSYEYKAALNNGWDENYGAGGVANGPNVALNAGGSVKFYYDHRSHWITSNRNATIATVPGSFQSELGCPGDWQPDCLRSWLQDLDGDGTYTLSTSAIPAGSYEAKVAINESWDLNYGANGEQNGANVAFTVGASATVTFSWNSSSHVLTITSASNAPSRDDSVWWDGLAHDSRDTLYRVPGGAVTQGTRALIRFRTYHDDVTGVTLRTWLDGERIYSMQRVARDVPCGLQFGCDFWQAEVETPRKGTLFYRFIVRDGSKTVYYEDDSDVRDGGWGKPFDASPDWGWAMTIYDAGFASPVSWMKNGVVYQIFADRFRNGSPANDPVRGQPADARFSDDPRYAYPNGTAAERARDRVLRLPWGALPEGFCRNYVDDPCPKRWQEGIGEEGTFGRDYYGGDLAGVIQKLPYLKELGVTVIFFNPIFAAASNHRYDTRDYREIDPYLGEKKDWDKLVRDARALGIRVILDGVFNHTSSDSPLFDRYHNFASVGACESETSQWRSWYRFRPPVGLEPAPCAGNQYYNSWAGFDSLPQLAENDAVRSYVNAVGQEWLRAGAAGWRLDVMQEKSHEFWREFRAGLFRTNPDTIVIGELWKKFDVLPYIQGDTADTAMNYRLRDATIGLLAPQAFDAKGFPGSGQPISPSAFRNRLESVREDYPDRTYFSLMNLLDSHDTERLLWTLTPGADNRAERELNAANLAEGKARQQLAALIQMTVPGAPTIYYGDEVALTGDDDPDDRRTYPWADETATRGGDTRQPDAAMLGYYKSLTSLRAGNAALRNGELRFLLADDGSGAVAYGRKAGNDAVLVVLNTSEQERTVRVPVAGYLPNGTRVGDATVTGGEVVVTLGPLSGRALEARDADLTPPAAPAGLRATANGLRVSLTWDGVSGAASYAVYRSFVTRGGYVRIGTTNGTSFTDDDAALRSGQRYHYVVRALDEPGNESANSNEAAATPSHAIGWANLQWPPTLDYTVSASQTTENVYGQVWIDGVTNRPGATPGLLAQFGYGAQGSDPATWTWVDGVFNVDAGNNDEFRAAFQPTTPGTYSYLARYSTNGGETWLYASLDGPNTNRPGTMTVHPPGDTTAPPAPQNLQANGAGPTSVSLRWDAVPAVDVFRYDVYRATTAGGPYEKAGSTDPGTQTFTDTGLATGTRYYYVVRAVDESANVSGPSNEASAVPLNREVAVTFVVTPPSTTPPDAIVHVAGNDPKLCAWCSTHTVQLTKGADGKWRTTISFMEGTSLEFKFTLGTWDFVEKDAACGEIGNRQAQVAGDASAAQTVEATVQNWRNVSPCGS